MLPGTQQVFSIHLKQSEHSDMQMIGQENCFTKHNAEDYHQLRRLEMELRVVSVLTPFYACGGGGRSWVGQIKGRDLGILEVGSEA